MGQILRRPTKQALKAKSASLKTRQPAELLEVRPSPIHRTGVFASRNVKAGSVLIEYVGKKVSKKESAELLGLKQNPYIFNLNRTADLNGKVSWNPARFINHSCDPNCEAEQDDDDRIWIKSTRRIQRGEELTYNYGYSLKDFRRHPCSCGASNCLGYMVAEDRFPALRRLLLRPPKNSNR